MISVKQCHLEPGDHSLPHDIVRLALFFDTKQPFTSIDLWKNASIGTLSRQMDTTYFGTHLLKECGI